MSTNFLDGSIDRQSGSVRRSILYSWAQLVRLPNVFTAVADVLAGATLAGGFSPSSIGESWLTVLLMVTVVVLLYWTGMIWNDLNDIQQDRMQQRSRPLVENRISVAAAKSTAIVLAMIAVAIVFVVAITFYRIGTEPSAIVNSWNSIDNWGPFGVSISLLLCIQLYNSRLKLTLFGPVLMGLCRSGSLLLGMSAGCVLGLTSWDSIPHGWVAAAGHGLFVAGFTWAGRREAEQNESLQVAAGWGIALLGLLTLASVSWFAPSEVPRRLTAIPGYPIVFLVMALPLIRRAYVSVIDPSPNSIQLAIKQSIFSIIFFDAILALQFGGPWPAIAICSLILPSIVLGRYFSPT